MSRMMLIHFAYFRDSTDLFGTGSFALIGQLQKGRTIGGGVEPDLQYAFWGTVGSAGGSCGLLLDAFDADIANGQKLVL